jgi:hypothetical protein
MALLWPLIARSAWGLPATVLAVTTVEGADLEPVPSVGLAQPATVVAGRTSEDDALAADRLVGVGLASHCGGGYDR